MKYLIIANIIVNFANFIIGIYSENTTLIFGSIGSIGGWTIALIYYYKLYKL